MTVPGEKYSQSYKVICISQLLSIGLLAYLTTTNLPRPNSNSLKSGGWSQTLTGDTALFPLQIATCNTNRRNFWSQRLVDDWNGLPEVDAWTVESFKQRLDKVRTVKDMSNKSYKLNLARQHSEVMMTMMLNNERGDLMSSATKQSG